jgi:UDP-glucose 4-epimerase
MPINNKPKILITGGAGYIGSHMVLCAQAEGYEVIVLDNLVTGHQDAVLGATFIKGDMQDSVLLNDIFAKYDITAVMHFAAFIQVGESVKDPAKYYHNNVMGTLNVLHAMLKAKVKYFIFSSTAAVYGEPQFTPITEKHPLAPINAYGSSKFMIEQVLQDYAHSYDFHYTALRYFNAAGADPEGRLAERHDPETHLIPIVLQAARGERKSIIINGQDYSTPDGTCVRDYIHVSDLCSAHLLALKKICAGGPSQSYNLGTGLGYSVQQVIAMAKHVTGCNILVEYANRRAGDPAFLIADASLARQELNWQPQYSDLKTIIEHAWQAYK